MCCRAEPSQADVAAYEAVAAGVFAKYPHIARWFAHVASYEAEHPALKGDKAAAASALAAAGVAGGAAAAPAAKKAEEDDNDDDVDLFGSDDEEEDAEAARIKAERVAEYEKKKAAKGPKGPAKSVVTLEVKPWDDETPMDKLEEAVRAVEMDGLVWGSSKLVPVGYGVSKLQITVVVEDDKVPMDDLAEAIESNGEDYVQSTDVAAMQKL